MPSDVTSFSGLNLAFFGLSRLQLEIAVATGNPAAAKVLQLRRDSNFLLTTILWGNVSINVLLTLLTSSNTSMAYSSDDTPLDHERRLSG